LLSTSATSTTSRCLGLESHTHTSRQVAELYSCALDPPVSFVYRGVIVDQFRPCLAEERTREKQHCGARFSPTTYQGDLVSTSDTTTILLRTGNHQILV
jgi:hypothetical protein